MCYIMKLECGEFTFRPPSYAKVTADGFSWQCDAGDLARLESDIADMALTGVTQEDVDDVQKELDEFEASVADAVKKADDGLYDAKELLENISDSEVAPDSPADKAIVAARKAIAEARRELDTI